MDVSVLVMMAGLWVVTLTFKKGFWPVLWTWLGCCAAALIGMSMR